MAEPGLGNILRISPNTTFFSAVSIFSRPSSVPPSKLRLTIKTGFHGKSLSISENRTTYRPKARDASHLLSVEANGGFWTGKALKWWEKGLQPNMKEISSAEDLASSLLNAGDQLVILDFYSPGCGGCKALHPKICQIAEMNADVQFLQINYEQHKSMCYSLHVHVLPFFRFYRGAQGRLCSFSCTNATIKKFKEALAKHTSERCSLGPARGLEEFELSALAANKDLSFKYCSTTANMDPARLEETYNTTVSQSAIITTRQEEGDREVISLNR